MKFTGGRIGFCLLGISGINNGKLESEYYIGIAGIIGLGIWEAIDAANEVEKYNSKLFKTIYDKEKPHIGFNLHTINKGLKLSLSYNF